MAEDDEPHIINPQVVWQVYRVPIVLGLVSFLFVALSITIFIKSYQPASPIIFSSETPEASVAGTSRTQEATILVDIEGAVVKPGVYRLAPGSRVDDVLKVAGGFTKEADLGAVARSMNRAAKLTDGAKLYIPAIGDSSGTVGGESSSGAPDFSVIGVNINTAPQSELEALPGVGPVTAGKIISGRPYMRIEELVEKKAMSQSLFDKLKEQLTL